MNIWSRWKSAKRKGMTQKRPGSGLRLTLAALLLSVTVLSAQPVYAQPSSERQESVVLSRAEADSVLTRMRMLEIDLWECESQARADSLHAEERLALRERAYEEIIDAYKDERPGWLERFVKQPVVWLAIGVYLGTQAH